MKRVKDIQHLADSKKGDKAGVFNPTNEDFTWKYNGADYTIPKGEMVEFDYVLAKHLAKHLIDKILTDKKLPTGKEELRAKWQEKVLI